MKFGKRISVIAALAISVGSLLSLNASVANSVELSGISATGVRLKSYTCVIEDGVNYRVGPGQDFQWLGTVNRGQGFNLVGAVRAPDGYVWNQGDLWGGALGVWIRGDFIGTC
ncbi:hypothetical protein GCM10023192_09940 [Amycolatopsis samaneae]